MVDETGSGKPVMCGVRSSTEVQFGPDPRISIQARGASMPHREAGHTEAPDRMPQPSKEMLASTGASTHGAMAVVRWAIRRGETTDPWLARMLARKPRMVVAVALANRMARIVWALMVNKEVYRAPAAA